MHNIHVTKYEGIALRSSRFAQRTLRRMRYSAAGATAKPTGGFRRAARWEAMAVGRKGQPVRSTRFGLGGDADNPYVAEEVFEDVSVLGQPQEDPCTYLTR